MPFGSRGYSEGVRKCLGRCVSLGNKGDTSEG